MAASTLTSKSYHARSISLPSRSHPLIPRCEELLITFNPSEAIPSSSAIRSKLIQLQDLYSCVGDLFQLPENQQSLSHEQQGEMVDGLLEGIIRLLEICEFLKDALSQNKEGARELQSTLRRRSGGESEIAKQAATYLSGRRMIIKANQKAMRKVKDLSNISKDQECSSVVNISRQVQAITMTVLESLMVFISAQKGVSSTGKWSLISKLMQSKRVSNQNEEASSNEFDLVDASLRSMIDQKTYKTMHIENVQILLEDLESSTQDLEEGVDCLYRELIRTRVSLLNLSEKYKWGKKARKLNKGIKETMAIFLKSCNNATFLKRIYCPHLVQWK